MDSSFFVSKCCGMMLASAIGDALGAPVEGLKQGHIKTLFKTLTDYADVSRLINKGIKHFRMKGLYTDDTQQTLAVCDAIIENNGFTPDKLSKKFIELCEENSSGGFGVFRGTGENFRSTMAELINGIPWDAANGNTAGCMAAVRIPPIIIHYFDDIEKMAMKVIEASLVTHKDPIAVISALWQASILNQLIQKNPDNSFDFGIILQDSFEFCKIGEKLLEKNYGSILIKDYHDRINAVSGFIEKFKTILLSKDEKNTDQFIIDYANMYSNGPLNKLSTPFALTIIPLSIKIFFYNYDSIEDTIITSINYGGDTDTLAALSGALSGAYHGINTIPKNWLNGLVNSNQIKLRAEYLCKAKKSVLENLVQMEQKLTQYENALADKFQPEIKKESKTNTGTKKITTQKDPSKILIPKEKDKKREYDRQKSKEKKIRKSGKIIY